MHQLCFAPNIYFALWLLFLDCVNATLWYFVFTSSVMICQQPKMFETLLFSCGYMAHWLSVCPIIPRSKFESGFGNTFCFNLVKLITGNWSVNAKVVSFWREKVDKHNTKEERKLNYFKHIPAIWGHKC